MTFKPTHFGLYFSHDHIQFAQKSREIEPIANAIHYLNTTKNDNPLIAAQLASLRYRFLDDETGGQKAVDILKDISPTANSANYRETVQSLLVWLSVIESIRTHSAWGDIQQTWFDVLRKQITIINQPPDEATYLDSLWVAALNIAAGIVLDDQPLFQRGTNVYKIAVDNHIHPEGFLKGVVDEHEVTDTYRLQVSGTAALVLMAEMAEHAGVDLWSINNRGVTPITACTYLLYYYYYPEKWKWEANLTQEMTQTIIATKGAFLEIANRHNPLRGIDILFEDQRPMFGIYCGGLTTLTHGTSAPQKKKRWRLFGN